MKLIREENYYSAYSYFNELHQEEVDEMLGEGFSDEELIEQDLNKQYSSDKYFVLLDFIECRGEGYFHLRVWKNG